MLSRLLCVSTALALHAGLAHADCASPSGDSERAQCIGQDLRTSDIAINDTYGQLRAQLSPEGQSALRQQEIAWIKARAAACHVDTREPDRDRWIAGLLRDYGKTICVVRFTERRVAELRAQEAALVRPAPLPPQPQASAPAGGALAGQGEVYELVAHNTPSAGKWYFEAVLNEGEIARDASAAIVVGVQGQGIGTVGTLQTIHRHNIGEPPVNIGIAFDLDAGKLYIRRNGAWQAQPGSAGGLDLKLGRPYIAKLNSSVPLGTYLDHGLVEVNFGQHAFAYSLPDGFAALDAAGPRPVVEE
jgi:uncharacterized protein YecT (DUF1311 family)